MSTTLPARTAATTVTASMTKAGASTGGGRIVSLDIDVTVPGLSDRYREGLLRAVNLCLIKNTLLALPAIEVRLTTSSESLEHVPALQ